MRNENTHRPDARIISAGVVQQRLSATDLVDRGTVLEEQFNELRASRLIVVAVCYCQAQWRFTVRCSC